MKSLSGVIYRFFFFSDYSGKYMLSHNKVFFYKNTTFPKNWKYIFLWINFILVSPVTLSVLIFYSLWGRDVVEVCRGERVTKKFLLTQHCVLFALWCQCSTSCRRFAVCNIPDRERRNIKISSSNKRSRQLKTLVLFFLLCPNFNTSIIWIHV